MGYQLQFDEVCEGLRALVQPGSVFELRLLAKGRKRVDGGYFDDPAKAASALCDLSEAYTGVYVTPNPVSGDLLARANNRIKPWIDFTTADNDVLRRLWLMIDIDPERPKGISSTSLEHKRAVTLANEVAGMLEIEYGWCQPMINSSGNGAHVLYPLNEPNTPEINAAVKAFLKSLAYRFDGQGCKIDTSVSNAARIWRVPGTWARKGDSTNVRPHRKCRLLQEPDIAGMVQVEQLQEFVDANPAASPATVDRRTTTSNAERRGQSIYRRLDEIAMRRIDDWVLHFFPGARQYQKGYRVSSSELGRDREEDLSIQPFPVGILDFGEHDDDEETNAGKRTPTSILAEFHFDDDAKQAATALAEHLSVPVTEFAALEDTDDSKSYREIFEGETFKLSDIKSYSSLAQKSFKDLKWVIPGVLPVGCFILAARPKMRKTWLALQLSIQVATGGKLLDWPVNKGKSLFLGLEDNERRIKSRVELLHTFDFELPDLTNFHYFTEGSFPRGDDGAEVLRQYLDSNPDCSLIVIDTFAHFRKMSQERDIYLKDYLAVMPLTRLASERQVCILVVHHEKKGLAGTASGDFIEDVNGSSGITGGVDGIISIKGRRGIQEENESRKLLITGRDIPHDYEVDMSFDAERGGWLPAARQDVKTAIRGLLTKNPFMRQTEIIALLPNLPSGRVRRSLHEMKFDGEVEEGRYGYSLKRD